MVKRNNYTRNFHVEFADGIAADVKNVNISYTYEWVLECRGFSSLTDHYMAEYEERRDLIEAGRLKGYYRFEPELVDEIEHELVFKEGGSIEDAEWVSHVRGKCFKDNKLSATLAIIDTNGEYHITLEWYQTTRELAETPLVVLVNQMAQRLKFSDIKGFCSFHDWNELA